MAHIVWSIFINPALYTFWCINVSWESIFHKRTHVAGYINAFCYIYKLYVILRHTLYLPGESWEGYLVQGWIGYCNIGYLADTYLNVKSPKFCWFITGSSIIESFWNFVQITAVSLSCFVRNKQTIGHLQSMLRANDISRDMGLGWVS